MTVTRHIVRVSPVRVYEIPTESDVRRFLVTSRDGRFYAIVKVEGSEPDFARIRRSGYVYLMRYIVDRIRRKLSLESDT